MARKKVIEEIEKNSSVMYDVVFEDVMHNSMIPYSESVILDRALPRVEDGLKPVQRRILYAMHEMGITPDKPYKKSARIVGDCMGKYHPHGDSSVYGAMVRMAQPFSMRMKLVDGHGNFGSIDGDGAAAMRYTEARMNPLALELLRDLDKNTVPWVPNFDDCLQEPIILPGRFPNLYVNGAEGIAVGLATKIPPHNLGEMVDCAVKMIDNPNVSLHELLQDFKGPDFPTGAIVIPIDTIESIYETGKGRIKIRSRIHIEDETREKKNIVITELPYQVSKSDLLQKIADLAENNKELLGSISDIIDESDKNGIRAVIKTKKDADVEKILDFLIKKTNLESNYAINIVAIANGKPEQLGLKQYLKYYVEYQREIIVKRTKFDLKVAEDRCEIVEGLVVAIRNIDEVVAIIKASKTTQEAKQSLKERFDLTDNQTQAIVDMRLKSLTHLEIDKLEKELLELEAFIVKMKEILASKNKQFTIVKKEMLEIKKANQSPRLSVIVENESDVYTPSGVEAMEFCEGVIALDSEGDLKFMSPKSFSKAGSTDKIDNLISQPILVNNHGKLFAFSNLGNIFKLDINSIPEKKWNDKFIPIGQIDGNAVLGEKIVKFLYFADEPVGELVFFTKNGMAKRSSWSEFENMKSSTTCIGLQNDELLNVELCDEKQSILTITKGGLSLLYSVNEIPVQGKKASGVKSIKLNDGDEVCFATQTDDEGEVMIVTSKGFAKRVILQTLETTSRYCKGVKIVELADGNAVVFSSVVKMPFDIAIILENEVLVVNTENVRIDTRTTKGKAITKENVLNVLKLETETQN